MVLILGALGFHTLQSSLSSQDAFSQEIMNTQEKQTAKGLTPMRAQVNKLFDVWTIRIFNHTKKILEENIWGGPVSPSLVALFLIPFLLLVTYMISLLFQFFFLQYLRWSLKRRAGGKFEEEEIRRIRRAIFPLLVVSGIRLSLVPLELLLQLNISWLKNILNAVIILMLTFLLKKVAIVFIRIWSEQLSRSYSQVTKQLLPLTLGVTKVAILAFGGIFAMASLGFEIAPFIASLGALTFAVGFAVKDSLSNFAAGILLIVDDSFLVGDKIDIPGIGFGYIHEIHLRTTRILTFDNEVIVVPNNLLMNKEYKNYRLPDATIRIVVDFSVAYGSKVEQVKSAILKILDKDPDILDEPKPVVEFLSMADFSLNFQAKGYVDSYSNQYSKKLELTEKVYNQLNKENIDIPFPTHTIHLEKK